MIDYPANQHHSVSSIMSECGMVMHCCHILSVGCTNILSHNHGPPVFRSNLFKPFSTCLRSLNYDMLNLLTHCLMDMTSIVYIKDIVSKLKNGPLETILYIQQQCCNNFHSTNIQWRYNMILYFAERAYITDQEFRILYSKDL